MRRCTGCACRYSLNQLLRDQNNPDFSGALKHVFILALRLGYLDPRALPQHVLYCELIHVAKLVEPVFCDMAASGACSLL